MPDNWVTSENVDPVDVLFMAMEVSTTVPEDYLLNPTLYHYPYRVPKLNENLEYGDPGEVWAKPPVEYINPDFGDIRFYLYYR